MYMGNIGPVAGVDFLIDSFFNAKLNDALLIIAGDGSKKAECLRRVERLEVDNILFVSVPDGKVPAVQSFANVLILPVNKGEAYNSVPSKLISYLFSGKPILASLDLDSDTSEFIKTSGAGWVVEPENKEALSLKMKEVISLDSDMLQKMGANGILYGFKQFSMLEGVKKLSNIIITASENHE
jgi:glycosyltransferase involved in cell wall biosynthesis